ncbi:carbohydrate ABC transporter permease [Paenibacillus eucommiae]|uniref:Multiple sugar transport system permease protein n=1 Tax=Paenibacillus eucommiae TaxID=1355755 RepID=A0ABS4INJ1_9BACL|nr:carbohydrate ABC transporter permease [Paenibacillus eucommiae]MBP1988481.1 multiple sugar transport system permease protein [Paenibacillus eucommiae]
MAETGRNGAVRRAGFHKNMALNRYMRQGKRVLLKVLIYAALFELSFLFLLPLIYILSNSAKSIEDYLDATVMLIPNAVHWLNYQEAVKVLQYWPSLKNTLEIVIPSSIGQLLSCALTGYGFARYHFPGKGMLYVILLIGLIVPPQTIIISLYSLFHQLGWLNSNLPFTVPAFFAQGLRGSLFILIFLQFFRTLPREMEEAARVDGAGSFRVFFQIMLPLVKPAIVLVGVFSFIWHWNDSFEPSIYFSSMESTTIATVLNALIYANSNINGIIPSDYVNEPILFACCLLLVFPLFVLYIFAQRFLTEGVERTGLVE